MRKGSYAGPNIACIASLSVKLLDSPYLGLESRLFDGLANERLGVMKGYSMTQQWMKGSYSKPIYKGLL